MQTQAVEQVAAELLVVALFADRAPPRGLGGRVDWRLCGLLSQQLARGAVRGDPGQAILIAGAPGLRAARIVGLGAGARGTFSEEAARIWVEQAIGRALDLRVRSAALELPDVASPLRNRVEVVLTGAARALEPRGAEFQLQLLVPAVLARAVHDALRSVRPRGLDRPIPIRLPAPLAGAEPDELPVALARPRAAFSPAVK